MRSDLTDITVVMDRSGSMSTCQQGAEEGLNGFIGQQKKEPGEAVFSLVQFDTEYEFVHRAKPIKEVPYCFLVPRGSTALLDALGRAIAEAGERLKAMPESARPGLVVFVVLTDGGENSSKEFTRSKIREVIEHQQSVYRWKFTFLGANQDAFAEAGAMGFAPGAIANYAVAKTNSAFGAAASNVSRMRSEVAERGTTECDYSDEERKRML